MRHATIYYKPEGFNTASTRLMGRQAAGEGFLRAAAQSNANRLSCHTSDIRSAQIFGDQLKKFGHRGEAVWVPLDHPAGLAEDGCLFLPGPNLTESAWQRVQSQHRNYSICGITHTTASHVAMSAITDLLIAPVHQWDALICTSKAVLDTVHYLIDNQTTYLQQKLGATKFELPQFPVIPLGVHCSDFEFSEPERHSARQKLGIDDAEIVILFVGRLSFHAKAHPQQMLTALERVSQGRRIRLLQCGWYPNDAIETAFRDAAALLCPSVTLHDVDGRIPDDRRRAWASADIFMSLSDNIQETFGLTPIEAMAAGLPVIVSDWDGYKDTARHGIDGFRIATLTPSSPLGSDLANRYELGVDNYDVYCGLASQLTAMDSDALTQACEQLIQNPDLRLKMGESGRRRAKEVYDWSVIYRRYQELWEELAERRRNEPNISEPFPARRRPDRPDPFAAFAGYPTSQISGSHVVSLLSTITQLRFRRDLSLNSFGNRVQLPDDECEKIFKILQTEGSQTVNKLVDGFNTVRRPYIIRGLVWLAKMEMVHIELDP